MYVLHVVPPPPLPPLPRRLAFPNSRDRLTLATIPPPSALILRVTLVIFVCRLRGNAASRLVALCTATRRYAPFNGRKRLMAPSSLSCVTGLPAATMAPGVGARQYMAWSSPPLPLPKGEAEENGDAEAGGTRPMRAAARRSG